MINELESKQSNILPYIRDAHTLIVTADYGGYHKGASYETISLLLASLDGCDVWEQKRSYLRTKLLPGGRRMSYKNLNDRHRRDALASFLAPRLFSRRHRAQCHIKHPSLVDFDSSFPHVFSKCGQPFTIFTVSRLTGFNGELTILRRYLRTLRDIVHVPRAFIRVESSPGDRFEVDWGHFGALDYSGDKRKLCAFCLIECHSRRLFVEFTHRQTLEFGRTLLKPVGIC